MKKSFNSEMTPEDRVLIASKIGFELHKSTGYYNGSYKYRNHLRDDRNPNLYIDFSNGLVKDFADNQYSGDIVNLFAKATGQDIEKSIYDIREIINSTDRSEYNNINIKVNKNKKHRGNKMFWNEKYKSEMAKCIARMKKVKNSTPTTCLTYDCILNITLKYFSCGLYSNQYKDYCFGSVGNKQIDNMVAFPYRSGVQLYTRNNGEKFIRNVPGSNSNDSLFFKKRDKDKGKTFQTVVIMKSPREAMAMWQNIDRESTFVFGICSSENAFNITDNIRKQIRSVVGGATENILVFLDCGKEDHYKNALEQSKKISNIVDDYYADVKLVNIYKSTSHKYEDFNDIVRSDLQKVIRDSSKNKEYLYKKYIHDAMICIKNNDNIFLTKGTVGTFYKCIKEAELITN